MVQIPLSWRSVADTSSPDQKLFALTKNVHTRLPREVRDIVYTYLLTPHEIFNISRCSRLRLDRFPYTRGLEPDGVQTLTRDKMQKARRPSFIDPQLAYTPFIVEVIELLYELYHDFWIDMPSKIPAFLATDFFGLNRTPGQARLSALHISGLLDRSQQTSVNLDTLEKDFKTLLDCTWAPNFNLEIAFRTELGLSFFNAEAIPSLAHRMHTTWQIMKPWIEEAEKRGALVYFVLLTRAKTYTYLNGKHNMLDTEEEWGEEFGKTLGRFCRIPRTRMAYEREAGGIESDFRARVECGYMYDACLAGLLGFLCCCKCCGVFNGKKRLC